MRQVYLNEVITTEPATPGHYFYDNPVASGKVLVIRNLAVYWDGFKATETGQFFIKDGARKIFLGDDQPEKQDGHAYWTGEVSLGEGDRAGVYCPLSAASDVVHFFICGELYDIEDWRG
ncbi:hypothetical protein ES702_05305 [subsurface metagenome]